MQAEIPYQLSHQGSPRILEWVAYPFSRGSSRPRNQTRVSASFRFEFDDSGFVWRGKKLSLSDIKSVDRSQWKKKGIVKLLLADGSRVTLDAWHHLGVKDFEKLLPAL